MAEMEDPYEGRKQSEIKHFVLRKYLSIACRVIGYSKRWDQFVYVDGFSGPWESHDFDYKDTSFGIAIDVLRSVKREIEETGNSFSARCLFIEKTRKSFELLREETAKISDFECVPVRGSFSEEIENIVRFISTDFSFVFVDPKGWKDTHLQTLVPILNLRGEVMINFMYRFINRDVPP